MQKLKQTLKLLLPKVKIRKKRKKDYIVVDFRDEYIKLPSGRIVPRDRILHIDTEKKVIVFLDENNVVREEGYA